MELTPPASESELHLIVLWETARGKEKEILEDMQKHVRILQAYDIQWTRERVADNFSRFYGVKLPDKSFKEIECGAGAFLLLVVRDEHPQYGFVETSRGHEQANLTLFSLKEKYRAWTDGGCKIHTTNSAQETNHDACLMLGKNYADLAASVPETWDGSITHLERDITGADGWESLQQFFYTLDATTEYVVLRGFEKIQETLESADHGDIDIMVRHYADAAMLVGGTYVNPKGRPHYLVRMGGKQVFIDLWDIDNHYHDPKWDEDIIRTAELHGGLMRVPRTENYFYMMVHHCLINKQRIAQDYHALLADLFVRTGLAARHDAEGYDSVFDLYFELLKAFMQEHGYGFTRPNDPAVFYSEKLVQATDDAELLQRYFRLRDVRVCHAETAGKAHNLFLTATDADGSRFFIKSGPHLSIYRNEYRMGRALWEKDPKHFVRPVYYRDYADRGFFIAEHVKGESLEAAMRNGSLTEAKKAFIVGELHAVFKALAQSDVVHRDVRPANFLLCEEGLKLVDFQLAIPKGKYCELPFMCENRLGLYALGGGYQPAHCVWDDAYSLLKVLNDIGRDESYGAAFDALQAELEAAVGKHRMQPSARRRDKLCQQFWDARAGKLNAGKKVSKWKRLRRTVFRKEKRWNNRRRVYLFGIRILTYGRVKEPAVGKL